MASDMSAWTDGATEAPENATRRQVLQTLWRNNISFALDCQNFFKSGLGRYLLARADEEVGALLDKLVEVNPYEPAKVGVLQAGIEARKIWVQWMNEAIQEGTAALAQLDANNTGDDNPEVKHD